MFRNSLSLLALVAPFAAEAAAPALIPVTGYLTDTTGAPINDTVTLHLKLYGATGTALWTENQSVDVDNGQFTVYLGDVTAVDLATFRDNGTLSLGVAVGTGAEMSPRFEIATAPFAAYAEYCEEAATVGGIDPADIQLAGDPVNWTTLQGVPADLLDGDQGGTAYVNGNGLNLTGTTFSVDQVTVENWAKNVAYDSLSEIRADLDSVYMAKMACTANQVLMADSSGNFVCTNASALPVTIPAQSWASITGRPAGLDDGDQDTTYTAGNGLTLASGAFGISEYAGGPLIPNARFESGTISGWTVVTGAGTVSADALNAAGGYSFKNTPNTVAWISSNTRVPVRSGQTYEVSGRFRRIDTVGVSTGNTYLAVRFFNSTGADIATGADGIWHYYPMAGQDILDNVWHSVHSEFGEGARPIPAGAVTMTVGAILNFNGGNRLYETTDLQIHAVDSRNESITTPGQITAASAWRPATFTNGWVDYAGGYNPAGFHKDESGVVHLRGLIRNGTVGAGAFTLPVGYRPAYQELQSCKANGLVECRIDITTAGVVQISSGAAAWTSLDGLSFVAGR